MVAEKKKTPHRQQAAVWRKNFVKLGRVSVTNRLPSKTENVVSKKNKTTKVYFWSSYPLILTTWPAYNCHTAICKLILYSRKYLHFIPITRHCQEEFMPRFCVYFSFAYNEVILVLLLVSLMYFFRRIFASSIFPFLVLFIWVEKQQVFAYKRAQATTPGDRVDETSLAQ